MTNNHGTNAAPASSTDVCSADGSAGRPMISEMSRHAESDGSACTPCDLFLAQRDAVYRYDRQPGRVIPG